MASLYHDSLTFMSPRRRPHSKNSSLSSSSNNSKSKSRSRSRTRGRGRTYLPDRSEEGRLHVTNSDESVRAKDLEEASGRSGKISDIWVASYPPLFAFVVFKLKGEADQALAAINNTCIRSCRV